MSLMAELHNAHKVRLQRITQAAERVNPTTDKALYAALNEVEEPVKAKPEPVPPEEEWASSQIEKHKELWFTIVRTIKVNRLSGPSVKDIQRTVCKEYGVALGDLLSPRRGGDIVTPRHVSMYLAKTLTTLSFPAIGRATGMRDHTTVLYAVRRIVKRLKTDENLAAKIEKIRVQFICNEHQLQQRYASLNDGHSSDNATTLQN